jgi:hypothetical protein
MLTNSKLSTETQPPRHAVIRFNTNFSLLNNLKYGNMLWREMLFGERWWMSNVDVKYGSMRGGWCSKEVGGSFGFGIWKSIRRGWDAFAAHVRYEINNDSKVLFWHDV